MAITDRVLSEDQASLSERYGEDILTLNSADQTYILNTGVVTGSDTLNTDVWVEYRTNNEVADGTPFI